MRSRQLANVLFVMGAIGLCSCGVAPTPPSLESDLRLRETDAVATSDRQESAAATGDPATDHASITVAQPGPAITLRMTGIKPGMTSLRIAVFTSADGFPNADRAAATQVIDVTGASMTCVVSHPPADSLAIAVFQDLNGDGALSKNDFRIPVEPYGFSNNARGITGPPTFQQAKISGTTADAVHEIQLK